MSENTEAVAGSFDSYKWPLIVFVLLLGHTSLMLLVMTLANADPPELVEGSPYSNAPPAHQSQPADQP